MGCGDSKQEGEKKEVKVVQAMPEYKVIVVGDSAVGKTAIIHQYVSGTFSRTHTMTTGVKNQTKVVELPNKKQI